MRKVKVTKAKSLLLGRMPEGCRLCIQGAKLVLFVTGLCGRGCYYCPLSEKRRGKDVIYANERPVRRWGDILKEAQEMEALGTGITGGNPTLKFQRTVKLIRQLKREFGPSHHIHLYSCERLPKQKLASLRKAGLDEIRFHLWESDPVVDAIEMGLEAGVELPVIPGTARQLVKLFSRLDDSGCKFVNLNELEFSETNGRELLQRGFRLKSETSVAVDGSEEVAKTALGWARKHTKLNVHYCPSSLKDSVQLKNRLIRKAKNIAKPHEEVTEDGLLYKGVILNVLREKLTYLRRRLISRYRIHPMKIYLDIEKSRIELHWKIAVRLASLESKLNFALIEEYPTHDRLETTVVPLKE